MEIFIYIYITFVVDWVFNIRTSPLFGTLASHLFTAIIWDTSKPLVHSSTVHQVDMSGWGWPPHLVHVKKFNLSKIKATKTKPTTQDQSVSMWPSCTIFKVCGFQFFKNSDLAVEYHFLFPGGSRIKYSLACLACW